MKETVPEMCATPLVFAIISHISPQILVPVPQSELLGKARCHAHYQRTQLRVAIIVRHPIDEKVPQMCATPPVFIIYHTYLHKYLSQSPKKDGLYQGR